jgi:hypothetical protein
MGDDGQLAAHLRHDVFQGLLPLGHALVDALAGGAAHIQALYSLVQQELRQGPDRRGADLAVLVIAGVKGGEDTLVFGKVFHVVTPSHKFSP